MDATYFFDPLCPHSWRTSRWLVEVAPARDVTIRWRSFSLPFLHEGAAAAQYTDVADHYRAPAIASTRALRLVEWLSAAGDDDAIGRFYTEIGIRTHDAGVMIDDAIVLIAAERAGIAGAPAVLADESWDKAIRTSLRDALELAGPEIGAPVLHVQGAARGLYGPVIPGDMSAGEGLIVWDATVALMRVNAFHELKRGRPGGDRRG